mmetsp:Transcript_14192/g.23508  ORF Transcript_14192/g.23508 Transcript_14192/m.23508 type:complete len:108 (+) Transcript_14192:388-711(+)
MRNQMNEQDDRAATELADMNRDRLLFPAPEKDHNGEPRWDGSEAERFLGIDITEGRHKAMPPRELRATRAAYQQHGLQQFRSHIYQEVMKRKFVKQYYAGNRNTHHN